MLNELGKTRIFDPKMTQKVFLGQSYVDKTPPTMFMVAQKHFLARFQTNIGPRNGQKYPKSIQKMLS